MLILAVLLAIVIFVWISQALGRNIYALSFLAATLVAGCGWFTEFGAFHALAKTLFFLFLFMFMMSVAFQRYEARR